MMSIIERDGCVGIEKGSADKVFNQRGNFTLKIVAKVEGGKDGYIARVTRCPDDITR